MYMNSNAALLPPQTKILVDNIFACIIITENRYPPATGSSERQYIKHKYNVLYKYMLSCMDSILLRLRLYAFIRIKFLIEFRTVIIFDRVLYYFPL